MYVEFMYLKDVVKRLNNARVTTVSDMIPEEVMSDIEDTLEHDRQLKKSAEKVSDKLMRAIMSQMIDLVDQVSALAIMHPEIEIFDLSNEMMEYANAWDGGERSPEFYDKIKNFIKRLKEILAYEDDENETTPKTETA